MMLKICLAICLLQITKGSLINLRSLLKESPLSKINLKKDISSIAVNNIVNKLQGIMEPGPAFVNQFNEKPDFCNDLDCPSFSVVKDVKDKYQLRRYEPTTWVTTKMSNIDYTVASYKMFMKLFQYISGANKAEQKIKMTAPVVVNLIPGQGPACENNFTMSFFIAKSLKNPPKPTDSTVFLQSFPAFSVYVRSFPGYVEKQQTWVKEARKLIADLNGTSIDTKTFQTAGYNSPFQLRHRHNEVWIEPK